MASPSVLAIFAHPDDIEFRAAGTMLLLKEAGWELHYMNVASGNCGSLTMNSEETAGLRETEARDAARILGARFHPSITHDLEIVYDLTLLRQITAIVRAANPSIVLTHAPADYMEDHMITSRLAVTAAFSKGMPNFVSDPQHKAVSGDVTVYHAMPHGLRDPLGSCVKPGCYVDTSSTHSRKRKALAAHRSQKEWLDQTQGMDSYLVAMDEESRDLGKMSGQFEYAEGWTRHLHLGFSQKEIDPLAEVLGAAVAQA